MNFTREPIIETIITPKEGNKLTLKSTKGSGSEYNVDAIEVVNFGQALFFRSLERPKAFLLPVSDFEVVETKETRVAIKSAQVEKSVKIAGGKSKDEESKDEPEKKRRRSRRRKSDDKKAEKITPPKLVSDEDKELAAPKTASLFAPPPTLISEQVQKAPKSPPDLPEGDHSAERQDEPPIHHADIEDFPQDEVVKPDPELFETSADVEPSKEIPTPTPDFE